MEILFIISWFVFGFIFTALSIKLLEGEVTVMTVAFSLIMSFMGPIMVILLIFAVLEKTGIGDKKLF